MRYLITAFFLCYTICFVNTISAQTAVGNEGPHLLLYKTRRDYRALVPVALSDDKKRIVSLPDPGDLRTSQGYAMPVLLHKGYLLDKRGIGKNVAFLKMTYKEYAALQLPPPTDELYKMIIDKDPLSSLCDCGPASLFKNPEMKLNSLIDGKKLKKACKTLR